jgi:hypothetical protein
VLYFPEWMTCLLLSPLDTLATLIERGQMNTKLLQQKGNTALHIAPAV